MSGDRTPKKPNSPPDPVIISWSGLKRWEACPQHQLRVIQHKTEKSNKGRIFLPGTVADLVQRRFLESDAPYKGQMEEMVNEVFTEVVEEGESKILWKGNPVKDAESVRDTVRTAVNRMEPWLFQNVLPYDYQAEVKFRAHMQVPYICNDEIKAPIKMIGGIDVLVRDDKGKFRIHDLKITKDPGYMKQTLAQLTFYDLAWGLIQGDFNHAVEWSFLAPLTDEFIIPVTVDHENRREMMSRIVKYAQGVWQDQWEPKASDSNCGWCEARGACDKFKVVPIVDENGKQRISFNQTAMNRSKFRVENGT